MSDTTERDAVLVRYKFLRLYFPDHEAMADRIVELEAAVERVRALHHNRVRGAYECAECLNDYPCPTLRALEETP